MRRRSVIVVGLTLAFLTFAAPAFACGGLLSPNGAVNLTKTTTLAAYHKGLEHYVTSFQFVGGGGAKFGSIVPLPGIPSKVEKAGGWTLQRLLREVAPPVSEAAGAVFAARASSPDAKVLLKTRVDALDITVLEGGGDAIARWATKNGFDLSPDAPEVFDFYASRSPIFLAAAFDGKAAQKQGLSEGDGTPIHVTIPTPAPWVPLRILGLGKQAAEIVQADVFLLTDRAPSMLPGPTGFRGGDARPIAPGMRLERSEQASDQLMADLSSDRGMGWMPEKMWLTYVTVGASAAELRYDLAIDASGANSPSYVAAGLSTSLKRSADDAFGELGAWPMVVSITIAALGIGFLGARRYATR
jgi:hypothetical protein